MESLRQYGKDMRGIGGFPWRALAWSLGAHALVLLALAPLSPAGETGVPPAQRLLAQLRSAPVPSPAVLPAPTFPAAAKLTKSAAPSTLTAQTKSVVTDAPMPTSPPDVAGGESEAAVVAMPSVALPAPAEPGAPDAAGLRQYRLALAREARRYRRYPEAARRAGLAGTVEVRIKVAANGINPQTELTQSSGHAQLDTAALEMLRLAAERTAMPETLRHRQFAVSLPVVFEVEE